MIGRTISHFNILEKIGEGGMGVVYKAEDTKLKRTVALKFLSPEWTRNPEAKQRLVREAQAASGLDHPCICTVHEIDEVEGRTFIAMSYIEGDTLEKRIQAGPLKLSDAVNIALQVAEGLQSAHEKEVVHRDIKPANIMVPSNDQAKIMDFGLAQKADQVKITKDGSTAGTIAYMSPEQARGEDVDHRTDIWSLGVVLYEMISGQLPFKGDYEAAVTFSIMNETPEPLTALRTGLPMELERIFDRCVEKNPDERYQTAGDLVAELRRLKRTIGSKTGVRPAVPSGRSRLWLWVVVPVLLLAVAFTFWTLLNRTDRRASAGRKMLVVLPFENLGAAEDEYFADGITEEITTRLAAIHGMGVIARTSAVQYRNTDKPVQQIGEELGVDYILEGTIRWQRLAGTQSQVRVTPQLIRVSDATHLWTASYQEDMTEVFRVQSEIAERVARALDITLLEPERRSLLSQPTENLEAHEYYLRGREYYHRRSSEEDTHMAIELLSRAVELDPEFAEAWATLARARVWAKWEGEEEELPKAEEAARMAASLAPEHAETRMALGDYYYYGSRDFERALEHYNAALRERPSQADAIAGIGYILRRMGKWEEAVDRLEDALELNPRDIRVIQALGRTYVRMRRFTEAERYLDRALSLSPDLAMAYVEKTMLCLSRDGKRERASSVMSEALRTINQSEFLYITPAMLIRILPGVFERAWEQFNLESPDINIAPDSAMFHLIQAEIQASRGKPEQAYANYDSARAILEPLVSAPVSPGYLHGYLGVAYAGLGRKDEAIQQAELAVEMLPISMDALSGPYHSERLAEVYVRVGEFDRALNLLEILLTVPSRLTPALIRLDPIWEPLREDPRFQMLFR